MFSPASGRMLLLSIDTCGPLGSVALGQFAEGRLEMLGQTELPGKSYSVQLLPAIRELLVSHDLSLQSLQAVVVTSGPGSFTGIRIGLSTAKGLAEVHSLPIVAVSRLAMLNGKVGSSASALDASRGEFFFGDYSGDTDRESLLSGESFHSRAVVLGRKLAVCDDAAHKTAPESTRVTPPTAEDALRFALPRLQTGPFSDPIMLEGNYLRRSDAEIFARPKIVSQP